MTGAKPSILITILCGPERDKWINPFLHSAALSWTNDERFDQEYILAYDYKTSQEARNWACSQLLAGGHDWLLMIDNDVKPLHRGQIVNLLDLATYDKDIVAAPCPVLQEGNLYLNCYVRQENGLYRSTMSEEFQTQLNAGNKLLERDAVGTGAIMLHRRVVQKMVAGLLNDDERERWSEFLPAFQEPGGAVFLRPRRRTGTTELGEDLFFCERARARGFRSFVSLPHLCGHLHSIDLADVPEIKLAQGGGTSSTSTDVTPTAADYGLPPETKLPPPSLYMSPPGTCELLREVCRQVRPEIIIEFGAGVSTLVFQDIIEKEASSPLFFSIENEVRDIAISQVRGYLIHAPIENGWYTRSVLEKALSHVRGSRRLMAFVDGPSTTVSGSHGRGLALSLIDGMFPGWTGAILLDDVQREGEAEDFRCWIERHPTATVFRLPIKARSDDPKYVHLKRIGILAQGVDLHLHPPDSRWDTWTAEDFGLTGPLPKLSAFSITPAIGKRLREILREVLLQLTPAILGRCLEVGAGVSTLVLAKALDDFQGDTQQRRDTMPGMIAAGLISLESSEARVIDVVKARDANGLQPYSIVIHAPIDAGWYAVPYGCIKPEHKFYFVFIDGPAGGSHKLARLPALFQLKDNLAPGTTIVLDDADREDEIECVRIWQKEFPGLQASFERVGERTLAVMRWPG